MRCMHERRLHAENVFLTLTYDDMYLPKGGTLVKRDLQLFMKKLRARLEPKKVRFYACGEYGSKLGRPHYHVLVFGWSPLRGDRKLLSKSKSGNDLYNSATASDCWGLGHVVCGDVDHGSCLYVANYVTKKFVGSDADKNKHYEILCSDGEIILREPEFALMSRRPGLGHGYVEKFGGELVAHDSVVYNGVEVRFPRYYDTVLVRQKFLLDNDLNEIKVSRRREAWKGRSDNTPDRRKVRERFAEKKLEFFKKGEL